jgi:hypothetical protein
MKNKKIPDLVYYPAFILIIVVSFLNFSALFFPLTDTNTALTILMVRGFGIPGDLYFWGQSFSGNLVPLLAHYLGVTYRFPPDMGVAVVHYAILIAGCFSISTLFRSRYFKILFAIIWFFPSWYFLGQITSVFGLQMSLLGIGIYLLNRYKSAYSLSKQMVWLALSCMTFIVSVWVSDLSVISITILLFIIARDKIDLFKNGSFITLVRERRNYLKLLLILFFILAGIGFLIYAKHHAGKSVSYTDPLLNDPSSLLGLLGLIFGSIYKVLIFSANNFAGSIYAWAIIIGVPLIFFFTDLKMKLVDYLLTQKWILFFTLNGAIILICLLFSHFVLVNNAEGKYFSVVFISFLIASLLILEASESSRPVLRNNVLLSILFLGIVSSLAPLFIPEHLEPRSDTLGDLKSLQNFGMIGKSELVYTAGSIDPDHIKVTPYDGEFLRNFNLVKDVLKQHRIYLLKNDWLSSFPDTITQYGMLMQRAGEPFMKSGYELCRYEQVIKRTIFPVDSLRYTGKLLPDSNAYSGKSAMISMPFDRTKHFIYGPFIDLHKGKYTVLYRLKVSRGLGINKFAVLNISANFGKESLATRTLRLCDFARGYNFEEFDVPLEISKDYKGVEFRIMYLGETDLYFDRVVLIEQ